jgi:nitrite reductase/ring-hydroxylating ferredoxin subunit
MICGDDFDQHMDRDLARKAQPHQLSNGSIITEIDTEFFLVFGGERHQFAGVNYCPFCGRALSRGLWNREKKK